MTSNLIFSGKFVLITGAGSGIGKAIAHRFASLGSSLLLADKDGKGVNETRSECSKCSPQKLEPNVIEVDLTLEADVEKVIKTSQETSTRLDVLINNAGIARYTQLKSKSLLKDFDDMFRLNVRAPLHLTQLAAPLLAQSKGCIVNVSSLAAYKATSDMLPYSMAKAALTMMTKNLAMDLGSKGIRVNEVNPGVTLTNIFSPWGMSEEYMEKFVVSVENNTPLGKLCRVEDVANAVSFLASSDAAMINGASLIIDGGMAVGAIPVMSGK